MPTRPGHSYPVGSRAAGGSPSPVPSRSLLCARPTRPRVGVLAASWSDLRELPGIAVAPAVVAPGHHHPVAWHDHQDGRMLLVAGVADQQARSLGGEAGLDPHISPSAQLAAHPYSSGRRMVVTDLSASVMIQILPAGTS